MPGGPRVDAENAAVALAERFLATFAHLDNPTSSALTRGLLGWQPTHPGLIADLNDGHYFA
jgi:hypothetical protein